MPENGATMVLLMLHRPGQCSLFCVCP